MSKPTPEKMEEFRKLTSRAQFETVRELLNGEEGQFFTDTVHRMLGIFELMPKTYETDGQGRAAVAHLHYFTGGCDWWIVEKDTDSDGEGQIQAFGVADLGQGCRELGYINLVEIIKAGAELDFHYTPQTVGDILKGGG